MNTKERIAEIVNEIVVTAFTLGLKNTPAPELYKEVKVDQLLGLFLSEEEIEKIIKEILITTPIAGDFDRTKAIYANEAIISKLAQALSTTLKPSWTELELDKVNKELLSACESASALIRGTYPMVSADKLLVKIEKAITDCKQALLGQGE